MQTINYIESKESTVHLYIPTLPAYIQYSTCNILTTKPEVGGKARQIKHGSVQRLFICSNLIVLQKMINDHVGSLMHLVCDSSIEEVSSMGVHNTY